MRIKFEDNAAVVLKDDKGNTLPVGVHNINLVLKAYLSPG